MQRENPLALLKSVLPTTQSASNNVVRCHTKRKHTPINKHTPVQDNHSPLHTYSLQCSKGSRLGHDCAYQGVINYHRVFPVCPY
jgi:hypothetical protein